MRYCVRVCVRPTNLCFDDRSALRDGCGLIAAGIGPVVLKQHALGPSIEVLPPHWSELQIRDLCRHTCTCTSVFTQNRAYYF